MDTEGVRLRVDMSFTEVLMDDEYADTVAKHHATLRQLESLVGYYVFAGTGLVQLISVDKVHKRVMVLGNFKTEIYPVSEIYYSEGLAQFNKYIKEHKLDPSVLTNLNPNDASCRYKHLPECLSGLWVHDAVTKERLGVVCGVTTFRDKIRYLPLKGDEFVIADLSTVLVNNEGHSPEYKLITDLEAAKGSIAVRGDRLSAVDPKLAEDAPFYSTPFLEEFNNMNSKIKSAIRRHFTRPEHDADEQVEQYVNVKDLGRALRLGDEIYSAVSSTIHRDGSVTSQHEKLGTIVKKDDGSLYLHGCSNVPDECFVRITTTPLKKR